MNTPLYQTVYEELQSRIRTGVYVPGQTLPSEPKLREEFGVSLITIRRAIHELVLDGLVESRQGIGNFVRDTSDDCVAVGMSSFTSDVASGRLRIVRTLMTDELIPAPAEIAKKLGVQPGSMVRYLMRLDYEGGDPMSIDKAYIPPAYASAVTPEIAASPLFMHLWQQASGVELVRTQYDIQVGRPEEEDTRLLRIDAGTPVLITGELIFNRENRPTAWVVSRYRGDRCKLSGTVTLVQRKTEHGIIGE